VFQELNYLLNVLGYNPPGDNEGNLFWMSWWFHNWNSILSSQDAHGTIARATVLTDCSTLTSALETEITTVFRAATGLGGICPTP
jgi:phospholipid/cholesterol/gamma-HCH transport system substrate-binding protein